CNTSSAESQDHLAVCSYYKTMWQKLKRTAIDLVWSRFTEEEKFRCPKHSLYKILTGSSETETQEKRRLWIKGLTSVDSFDAIKDLLNSSKTSARSIELAAHLMWNDRCIKVIDWEEKQNIRKRDKREARNKNLKPKKNTSSNTKSKKKIKTAKRREVSAKEIK
ncbi:16337_t:CDS:2, partial [Cetraspora pellucida]